MNGDAAPGSPTTRVVVVDGNEPAGATAAAILTRAGFEAVASDDPAAALEAVRTEGVSVVVVGGTVGDRPGPAIVTDVRDHGEAVVRDVSVVVLVDDAPGADAALAAGADSVLLRPVEADRLAEAVGDVARLDASSRSARRRHR